MNRSIDIRRRMSLEKLALCHVATVGRGTSALAAASRVTREERSGILYGQTFADTLALSRPLLDLYEHEAHIASVPSDFGRLASVFEPSCGLSCS